MTGSVCTLMLLRWEETILVLQKPGFKRRVQEEGLRKTMPTVKEEKNASRVRKTGLAWGLL